MAYLDNIIDNQIDSDLELLQLIKISDRKSFEIIYNKYCDILFEHAYRIIREREVCMDIVQEIFTWFWTNREYLEINSLKPYLLAAVKFQVANYIRKNKMHASYVENYLVLNPSNSIIEKVYEIKELKNLIGHLTDLLPEKCRQVFILSREEHLTNKQIAEKLGISEKTVEMHITLALKRLRVCVGQYLNLLLIFF